MASDCNKRTLSGIIFSFSFFCKIDNFKTTYLSCHSKSPCTDSSIIDIYIVYPRGILNSGSKECYLNMDFSFKQDQNTFQKNISARLEINAISEFWNIIGRPAVWLIDESYSTANGKSECLRKRNQFVEKRWLVWQWDTKKIIWRLSK